MPLPKYHELFNPVLTAITHLGDSASIAELDEEVDVRLEWFASL